MLCERVRRGIVRRERVAWERAAWERAVAGASLEKGFPGTAASTSM